MAAPSHPSNRVSTNHEPCTVKWYGQSRFLLILPSLIYRICLLSVYNYIWAKVSYWKPEDLYHKNTVDVKTLVVPYTYVVQLRQCTCQAGSEPAYTYPKHDQLVRQDHPNMSPVPLYPSQFTGLISCIIFVVHRKYQIPSLWSCSMTTCDKVYLPMRQGRLSEELPWTAKESYACDKSIVSSSKRATARRAKHRIYATFLSTSLFAA